MEFGTRRALGEELGAVARLNAVVQAPHHRAHPDRFATPSPAEVEGWLRAQLVDPERAVVFVAEAGGELVGYVLGFARERPASPFGPGRRWCELDQIAVRPEMRGRGVARALVAALEGWARDRGLEEMQLEVWAFNADAAARFVRLGFSPLRTRMGRMRGETR